MEKYLIKKDANCISLNARAKERQLKQTTLESLKGVVVIEDVWRHKSILEWKNQSTENLLKSLEELKKKTPSKEILLSTKIGHVVHKLCKHSNSEVSTEAKQLYNGWKSHILNKANKPTIEVRCDLQTENFRTKAKKLLAVALSEKEDSKLVNLLEREIFHLSKRLVNGSYRRTVRKVIFTFKHTSVHCEELKLGKLTVQELLKLCKR